MFKPKDDVKFFFEPYTGPSNVGLKGKVPDAPVQKLKYPVLPNVGYMIAPDCPPPPPQDSTCVMSSEPEKPKIEPKKQTVIKLGPPPSAPPASKTMP